MNRYPLWKYAIMAIALVVGLLYTLPNIFGEDYAVQVASLRDDVPVDDALQARVLNVLQKHQIEPKSMERDAQSLRVRLHTQDAQVPARDAIAAALVPDENQPAYSVALNLLSRTPAWLQAINAKPMYLGLDLRGGVHFTLQVDMDGALVQRSEALLSGLRTALRERNIRHGGLRRDGQAIDITLRNPQDGELIRNIVADHFRDLTPDAVASSDTKLRLVFAPEAVKHIQEQALKQNITTLHNRVNELGVAEPVIQQEGSSRIVVQLPGVQDVAQAKRMIGRTATLQVRMVDESTEGRAAESGAGPVPFGSEVFNDAEGQRVIVQRQVVLTGENLIDAQPGFDTQRGNMPVVNLEFDGPGARIFRDVSRENVGKRMAIILFERGRGTVVTAPVIRQEIAGGRVQISGSMTTREANEVAVLLRSGALAAPMEIIEEYTIGPSLGQENIERGQKSVLWGMLLIVAFMCAYYMMFGVFSSLSLAVNILLLLAVLSMLQATLTLPGIAAMALALGVAIDSNVLINERIREELRAGASPQAAIHAGYERAWATILDSNVTTLIAGFALLAFGHGPVRGFAVVHCIGVLTSMFSAVFFSRGLVNLWYGRRKRLKSISIGQVWRPEADAPAASAASAGAAALASSAPKQPEQRV
ncbi:protein translocase subunit SecD [Vandammella animalimorsus]|uniref:Protein translocase subunit SecD n=1 Tax=Vandammella animalimorsus TaxID=2029117 RepID=A0A2A2T2K6_9BURK|nr:protein translocase subunit SecD [Vandammella animalimorsus]PAT31494.1 protein translocase subunit SecD [Vandammella animalimorsus]PAX15677.1 protein translocase subunit SecD [Vandammella animalimorsus]PAX19828.1 protein translocase subunit SecD [Vandammella animalimorsus]